MFLKDVFFFTKGHFLTSTLICVPHDSVCLIVNQQQQEIRSGGPWWQKGMEISRKPYLKLTTRGLLSESVCSQGSAPKGRWALVTPERMERGLEAIWDHTPPRKPTSIDDYPKIHSALLFPRRRIRRYQGQSIRNKAECLSHFHPKPSPPQSS